MRATATSCTKSPRLVQVRTAPPAVELAELSFGTGPLPISAWRTAPSDPDTMQWAHGYSGCIGVAVNGGPAGSRAVAALPSKAPCAMGVLGRTRMEGELAETDAD